MHHEVKHCSNEEENQHYRVEESQNKAEDVLVDNSGDQEHTEHGWTSCLDT